MGKTANETLQDLGIRHAVYFQRLATNEVNEIIRWLNNAVFPDVLRQLSDDLSRSRRADLTALLQVLRGQLRGAMEVASARATDAMTRVAESEVVWQARTLAKAVPIAIDWKSPTAGYLRATVVSRPFQGATMGTWFAGLADGTARRLDRTIRAGLAEGQSIPDLIDRVRGKRSAGYAGSVLETTRRQAAAIVRTAANQVSNDATIASFRENGAVVKGWRFLATLDSRTTLVCQTLDGQVFPLEDQSKAPPRHWGCRSRAVPVLKSWREMGIDIDEAPAGTRASLTGQVPATTKYEDWLRDQPRTVQNEILGAGRADIFRAGGVAFERFVDDRGRPVTIEGLRRLEEAA